MKHLVTRASFALRYFKDVRAQKFPRTDFFKLWLQVENDKIRGHRARFEDKV